MQGLRGFKSVQKGHFMKLTSRKILFNVCGETEWQQSHAMMPTPFKLSSAEYRIFYGSRNALNQSHIGSFVIDVNTNAVTIEDNLILGPGDLGCFDDNGVLPSCCIEFRGETLLYYVGFKPGGTTRMDLFGGLAIYNQDKQKFERWSKAPIIERNKVNPFINTAPFVIEWDGQLIMYYVAGIEWVHSDLPRYHIQIASSKDGRNWVRNGLVAIDFKGSENALARPFVYETQGRLRMLFSSKGENYKICAAVSTCGYVWDRTEFTSDTDAIEKIDNEMQCYPVLIGEKNNKILYNGNGYGKTGIIIGDVKL